MSTVKHILLIPSWYKNHENPHLGTFFTDQALALKRNNMEVGLIFCECRSLKSFSMLEFKNTHFNYEHFNDRGINTVRFNAWNPFPKMKRLSTRYWVNRTVALFEEYISIYGIPDIIHAHSAIYAGYAASIISKKYNIPYVLTEHFTGYARGIVKGNDMKLAKKAFEMSSSNIAVSTPFAKLLEDQLGLDRESINVIPNLIDTDFFYKYNEKDKEKFIFQTTAFLTEKKNISFLVESFYIAFKNSENVMLRIGGDGEEKDNLSNLVKKLGIENKVEFLGALNREEVRDAIHKANVFVLPSRYETFGVVLIEALSTGIPVIATRCGGPEDIIQYDGLGEIINVDDKEALSRSMMYVYKNYDKYNQNEIRKFIINNYSQDSITRKNINIYNEVLYNI
ncbi:glycosyltransferase [Clostridium hydrogeniformans]|uniref:glycosyltransferase n=1 Tax=Clostridium hydrogeniformans TaxID=349933 RepID=UPI00047FE73F|nr:glycosyltransferase [Clostridium hydrogeniformans]